MPRITHREKFIIYSYTFLFNRLRLWLWLWQRSAHGSLAHANVVVVRLVRRNTHKMFMHRTSMAVQIHSHTEARTYTKAGNAIYVNSVCFGIHHHHIHQHAGTPEYSHPYYTYSHVSCLMHSHCTSEIRKIHFLRRFCYEMINAMVAVVIYFDLVTTTMTTTATVASTTSVPHFVLYTNIIHQQALPLFIIGVFIITITVIIMMILPATIITRGLYIVESLKLMEMVGIRIYKMNEWMEWHQMADADDGRQQRIIHTLSTCALSVSAVCCYPTKIKSHKVMTLTPTTHILVN